MKSIWKFMLNFNRETFLMMPEGAHILSLQTQKEQPHIWALVDTEAPLVKRRFYILTTGEDYLPTNLGSFIGTFQVSVYVYHVFGVLE